MATKTSPKMDPSFVRSTGLLTFLALAYEVAVIVLITSLAIQGDILRTWFTPLFIINTAIGLVSLYLLVVYLRHIVKSKKLDNDSKVLWVIMILFFSPIAMAIYWHRYFWKPLQPKSRRSK